ncbi:hypothetical protein DRN72_02500 [Methanosarcinales archaeon]|nr:MAG: hypothetical protein DRN72_02500 [Methanosarcinales archaeon]
MYRWPGRGRFSYLPPWERPGGRWWFRRFRGCWWWAPWWFPYSPEEEIKVLKEYRDFINEELKWIEKRITELRNSNSEEGDSERKEE